MHPRNHLCFLSQITHVCWKQYHLTFSVWGCSPLWCWGFVCVVFLFQICESLITFSVGSMGWIIQRLGKFIQNDNEVRVFSLYLSKLTASQKLLFVLLSQCGDLRIKVICVMYAGFSWWCLTCFFLPLCLFPSCCPAVGSCGCRN